MNLNKHGSQFLKDIKYNLNTVQDTVDFCLKNRLSKNDSQIRILANCFLSILYEVRSYLDYFEEDIERTFGFSTEVEWNNIMNDVILKTIDDILKKKMPNVGYINDALIETWVAYDRKNAQNILRV